MNKRIKFVLTSLILSSGFVAINLFDFQSRFISIGILALLTVVLFFWSLREGLHFDATLLTLVLPLSFTLGVGFFWFLLPSTIYARIPIVIFYGAGIYSLIRTANIFMVSTIRTIALVRAARGFGFILTLISSFLLFDALLSIRANLLVVAFGVWTITFPLIMQGLWFSVLERYLTKDLILYSIILSTSVTQIAAVLYFWPVSVVVGSLALTVAVYTLLGLGQAKLEGRLFAKTIKEYLFVATVVFVVILLATHWGGKL